MFNDSIEKTKKQDCNKKQKKDYAIEEILSSKGRIVILKTLAEKEELNISAIARKAKLNHTTTTKH
jgi:predicted transcriptional regulator